MTPKEFETAVAEAFALVPEKFRSKVENVALLIEDEPSDEMRKENNLQNGETLFGLYRGIPQTERGEGYGVGGALPDTITIFKNPILEAGAHEAGVEVEWGLFTEPMKKRIRIIIRDTIWHEIAHHFGMDELEVGAREVAETNSFEEKSV
ncbi:metallopeptidase family protein [Patescibacteria group bacterium]|nr:MAG: metallopeptidase family protein [Patescibacteria group bacterium]